MGKKLSVLHEENKPVRFELACMKRPDKSSMPPSSTTWQISVFSFTRPQRNVKRSLFFHGDLFGQRPKVAFWKSE